MHTPDHRSDNPPRLDHRYLVLKREDLKRATLTLEEKRTLERICQKVETSRQARGASPDLAGVFIERDWPEYAPAVGALAFRIVLADKTAGTSGV